MQNTHTHTHCCFGRVNKAAIKPRVLENQSKLKAIVISDGSCVCLCVWCLFVCRWAFWANTTALVYSVVCLQDPTRGPGSPSSKHTSPSSRSDQCLTQRKAKLDPSTQLSSIRNSLNIVESVRTFLNISADHGPNIFKVRRRSVFCLLKNQGNNRFFSLKTSISL